MISLSVFAYFNLSAEYDNHRRNTLNWREKSSEIQLAGLSENNFARTNKTTNFDFLIVTA
jgi:hypothetical protein